MATIITGADRGIRVNVVAPGPVWTPLVAATTDPESLSEFGSSSGWVVRHNRRN